MAVMAIPRIIPKTIQTNNSQNNSILQRKTVQRREGHRSRNFFEHNQILVLGGEECLPLLNRMGRAPLSEGRPPNLGDFALLDSDGSQRAPRKCRDVLVRCVRFCHFYRIFP